MKHWVGHIRSIGYTTYEALNRSHMKNWVGHIWDTEYTTYEALNRSHMEHWVGHIWGTEYTTYGALNRLHMKHWIGHIWSTEWVTYEALNILHIKHWIYYIWSTEGAVGLIRSYFALFENFDGALGKFQKNEQGFAYNDISSLSKSCPLCCSTLGNWQWLHKKSSSDPS